MDQATPQAKVLFRVPNDDGTADVETLWATPLGNNRYQIDNSPFYAYGVSWNDVVFAPFNSDEGFPVFESVVGKSGHKTVRVIFDPPVEDGNESDSLLQGLVVRGCSYEGMNRRYMSIDISPSVDIQVVREYLIESDVKWEHADPTFDELFPEAE